MSTNGSSDDDSTSVRGDMALPSTFQKLVAIKLTNQFRNSVSVKTVPMLKPGPQELLVRNRFVGINASDINKTAGLYSSSQTTPFDIGFEAVGEVVAIGIEVNNFKLGQGICYMSMGTCISPEYVAKLPTVTHDVAEVVALDNEVNNFKIGQGICHMSTGAFAEYVVINTASAIPIPSVRPEHIGLLVSGMTADISLREFGKLQKGESVLVTAAAGGSGQFAVQYAKLAGCHVIGTCSTESKAQFLKSIGCDRAINYKTERLDDVLKKEYPKGVDVVYESIGGDMFHTCFNNLSHKGRLLTIGFVSGHSGDNLGTPQLNQEQLVGLLWKSISVNGFFLCSYYNEWHESFARQAKLLAEGSLKIRVDLGKNSEKGYFKGIESIVDAVEYLYTKKSEGKIVVEINEALPSAGLL